jgi:hypothetical protein
MRTTTTLLVLLVAIPATGFAAPPELEGPLTALSDAMAIHQSLYRSGNHGEVHIQPVLPLPEQAGITEVRMLSSYAPYLAAIEALDAMGKPAAVAALQSEIGATLATYAPLYDEQVARNLENWRNAPDLPPGTGIGYSTALTASPEDGPTLEGMRLKTLALLGLVATHEADACTDAVRDAVALAVRQRTACVAMEQDETMPPSYWFFALTKSSLYNRQILGTAMLATVKDRAEREALVRRLELKTSDPRFGGSGEQEALPICEDMTDAQFDALVEAVYPGLLAEATAPQKTPDTASGE